MLRLTKEAVRLVTSAGTWRSYDNVEMNSGGHYSSFRLHILGTFFTIYNHERGVQGLNSHGGPAPLRLEVLSVIYRINS